MRDVSFQMHDGEIVGLTGLIGSGFEEVAHLLYGARSARAGRLVLDGGEMDLTRLTPPAATRSGIALIPADRKTDGSVGSLPVVREPGARGARPLLQRHLARAAADAPGDRERLMQEFDVRPNDPSLPYGALSGGNQQKALLAKWFQTEPRLLLLDEPTQGVDVGARQQIFGLIRTAVEERGMHVLCASSDYEQLSLLCDRVIVFGRGRVWRELVGERRDEGADHRAELRGDGGRSRRRGRVSEATESKGAVKPAATERSRSLVADIVERYALLAVWGVVIIVFGILRPDTFLTTANFSTIFGSQAVLVVLTLALLPPLTAGDYDLSVAATMGLAGMTLAILNVNHGWSIGMSIAAALAIGLLVGIINGAIVVLLGIDSLIVTLGTSTFIAGVILWISNSQTISGVSIGLIDYVVVKQFLGIPLAFYYGIALGAADVLRLRVHAGRQAAALRRARPQRRAALRHPRRAAALGAPSSTSGVISAFAGVLYVGTLGLGRPDLESQLPAAGVRRGVPRRDDDHARPLQPARLDRRRLLPRHRHHGAPAARRADVRPAALLRRSARARGRAVAARAQARRARLQLVL